MQEIVRINELLEISAFFSKTGNCAKKSAQL